MSSMLLNASLTRPAYAAGATHSRRANTSARRFIVPSAVEENSAPETSTTDTTVFYGGKSYTESEWKDAVAKGTVASSSNSTVGTANAPPSFGDVMAFSGAGPELINGRLAQLGFVAALGAELATGESVLQQLKDEPTLIALTFILFAAGSLVPLLSGVKPEDEKFGIFTAEKEKLNGRAAMIGFASLIIIEAVRGSALF